MASEIWVVTHPKIIQRRNEIIVLKYGDKMQRGEPCGNGKFMKFHLDNWRSIVVKGSTVQRWARKVSDRDVESQATEDKT